MKRIGNLYNKICSLDNLRLAHDKARRGKAKQYGVRLFEKDTENNLVKLHLDLMDGSYRTSEYKVFTIHDPKEREIYSLPFRDRIVHHAVMNVLEPIWTSVFIRHTYSCIKNRGIHDVLRHLSGIDFVGYRFYHTHILMRKSIKKRLCRKAAKLNKKQLAEKEYRQRIAPWLGWAKHCNSRHLLKTVVGKTFYFT